MNHHCFQNPSRWSSENVHEECANDAVETRRQVCENVGGVHEKAVYTSDHAYEDYERVDCARVGCGYELRRKRIIAVYPQVRS